MGGKAFAHHKPPLLTPRISSALYCRLRDKYIGLLSKLFQYVATPLPAPGKTSHGDIDVLVAAPLKEYTATSPEKSNSLLRQDVEELLKPRALLRESETLNLAIPHPEQRGSYIQLDVHIVPTVRQWHWLLFTHTYGDAFSLIGTSLHQVGLVGTDKGLFARDTEMEVHDGKKSRIFLSDDPASVLTFLHLNPSNWLSGPSSSTHAAANPFASCTDLFRAISSMRYFSIDHFYKSGLRASDRQRLSKRELYTNFVDEFLPTISATSRSESSESTLVCENSTPSREQVFRDALAFWKKEDDWCRIKTAWERDRLELMVRRAIREDKKTAMAEEERYSDAWLAWSGFCLGEG